MNITTNKDNFESVLTKLKDKLDIVMGDDIRDAIECVYEEYENYLRNDIEELQDKYDSLVDKNDELLTKVSDLESDNNILEDLNSVQKDVIEELEELVNELVNLQ